MLKPINSLTMFMLFWAISTINAQSLDVSMVGAYGSNDFLRYGIGFRAGLQSNAGPYGGFRLGYHPFHTRIGKGPCYCLPPGYEPVDLDSRVTYVASEMGFQFILKGIGLRPSFLLGTVFTDFEKAFGHPADGPPIIVSETDKAFLYAPGLLMILPLGRFFLGAELFYLQFHNFSPEIPAFRRDEHFRSYSMNLALGYKF